MSHSVRRRRQNEHLLLQRLLFSSFIGGTLALFLAIAAFFLFQVRYNDSIYPGVEVSSQPLGGMDVVDATLVLTNAISYPKLGEVIISGPNGERWSLPPADLGLSFDPAATSEAAFAYGRQGGLFQRLGEQIRGYTRGISVSPRFIFDQQRAKDTLQQIVLVVEVPQTEPSLKLNGTQVEVTPGRNGLAVNMEGTLAEIEAQIGTLNNFSVTLQTSEVLPMMVDVDATADKARSLLSEPLIINMPGGQDDQKGPWTIEPQTLAGMLTFALQNSADGKPEYALNIQREGFVRFLATVAPELQRFAADPRFIFNDDTKLLELYKPGVIGRTLNMDRSLDAINESLLSGSHQAELQFDFTEPRVKDDVTGESLGIIENTHIEYSYFYGSAPERVQNIIAAAENFQGVLIAPGETFSMANAMSDITLDNGYAEAPIIVGGRTVEGIGGGICQVSTTLFRAVFNAGYAIAERHPHAYRVGYYEQLSGPRWSANLAGLDATVFVPIVDFKFVNDSPYWLLMETYVHPQAYNIMWKFYSTGDGRTVEWHTTGPTNIIEAPKPQYEENPDLANGEVKQVDWAADGAEVTVTRKVTRAGEIIIEDTFYTKYQPWRAVYQYGPGTEGMPPPEEPPSE